MGWKAWLPFKTKYGIDDIALRVCLMSYMQAALHHCMA
jgi:hypothetical protein